MRRLSARHPDKLAQSGLILPAFFCPRDRTSVCATEDGVPLHPAAFASLRPHPSSHSRRPVVVPADGSPRPPECKVTSPARRRRIRPHLRNVSRRRPSVDRTDVRLYTLGILSRGGGGKT